jgi:hypothetical protein
MCSSLILDENKVISMDHAALKLAGQARTHIGLAIVASE